MARIVVALVVEVVLAIVVALLLGTLWQWFLGGDLVAALGEGARLLFLFMDVGLVVWVVILVVLAVRRRRLPGAGETLLAALLGVAVNAVVVIVVGFVQGGWAPLFVLFAITAGFAFLVAVLVVTPIVHRLVPSAVAPPAAPSASREGTPGVRRPLGSDET